MNLKTYMAERMQDPEFRAKWNEEDLSMNIATLLIEERIKAGLSQEVVAARAKVQQPSIARLESGDGSLPNVFSLQRYAHALGKKLHISFI